MPSQATIVHYEDAVVWWSTVMRKYPGRVENYTNAFLVTAGMLLFMVFFTMAATVGFVWVVLSAVFLDGVFRFAEARRSNR